MYSLQGEEFFSGNSVSKSLSTNEKSLTYSTWSSLSSKSWAVLSFGLQDLGRQASALFQGIGRLGIEIGFEDFGNELGTLSISSCRCFLRNFFFPSTLSSRGTRLLSDLERKRP